MQPIVFERSRIIPRSAADICTEIADTDRWREFQGYGVLPGIERAEYEKRTGNMIGSRILVRNTDGSKHVEEVTRWDLGKEIYLILQEFTLPLSRFTSHFIKEWCFRDQNGATLVTRRIQMFPIRPTTRPILWLISLLLRQAISYHLSQMAAT